MDTQPAHSSANKTKHKTKQNRTEQNRTEQNRTRQKQNKSKHKQNKTKRKQTRTVEPGAHDWMSSAHCTCCPTISRANACSSWPSRGRFATFHS
eukprot:COSAG02_NODE_40098_length_409_cov_0.858065_1_plen_93_part_10